MKTFALVIIAVFAWLSVGCDLLSNRQRFLERNLVGVWGAPDERVQMPGIVPRTASMEFNVGNVELEFFADGSFVFRVTAKDVSSPDPSVNKMVKEVRQMAGAKPEVLDQGTWTISEDGRIRLTSSRMLLGMGTKTGQAWIFPLRCRSKSDVLLMRFDDNTNLKFDRIRK